MEKLCQEAVRSYTDLLCGSFEIVSVAGGCLLVTPFQRQDGEFIELEMCLLNDGKLKLTDNGDTIGYLWVSGLNIRRRGMRKIFGEIASRYGVEVSNDEISKLSSRETIGQDIDKMLRAVQDVSYLIYKREFRGVATFDEEVEKFITLLGDKVSALGEQEEN